MGRFVVPLAVMISLAPVLSACVVSPTRAIGTGFKGSSSGPTPKVPTAATLSLPGEQTLSGGVSSYVFGTNDTIEYGSPNVDTLPSVQNALKTGGLTLMRTWAYSFDTDASILGRIQTIKNSGMQCMMMLGSPSDLTWMEHVVAMVGSGCDIYEFGNEPDNPSNHTSITQMVTQWNASIPALRAINPSAVFGGPAVTYAESAYGTTYPSDIAYFLVKTAASGVRADFISYHDYSCGQSMSKASCLAYTPGDISANYKIVIGWERQYYGTTVPTGMTEYNFDPGTGNLYSWGDDSSFMYLWTETALKAIIAAHMAFANEFTTLNDSGYGYLDMFEDSSPYAPKAQFYAMVAMRQKSGGP
jgi:hypothetical protein